MLDVVLAVTEAGSESPIDNPLSDAFYDAVPYILALLGGGAVAFRERVTEGLKERRKKANEPIYDELAEIKKMISDGIDDLKGRSGPSPEEITAALEILQSAGMDIKFNGDDE